MLPHLVVTEWSGRDQCQIAIVGIDAIRAQLTISIVEQSGLNDKFQQHSLSTQN